MQASVSARGRFAMVLTILTLIGLALSAVSLVNHYRTTASDFCDISGTFNCDIVNRSIYSVVFGIPVALIGVLGYVFLMVLANLRRDNRVASAILLACAVFALGFSLYLTYVEKFLLATWCILCLGSLATIVLITIFAAIRVIRPVPST